MTKESNSLASNCKILTYSLKACTLLGESVSDQFSLRISLVLVLIGASGLYVEIINAFEYVQSARRGF